MKKIFTKNMEKRPIITFIVIMLLYFIVAIWPSVVGIICKNAAAIWFFIQVAWAIALNVICLILTKD